LVLCFLCRANASEIRIVTSFYPVYIATLNVAGNAPEVQVINLTRPFTGCLHDYQLSPDDMKTLARADIFIINGAGMEAFLDKAARTIRPDRIIDASRGIELIRNKNGAVNPHVWLNIALAARQVRNIAAGLEKLDPSRAGIYRSNCAEYVKKLEELHARMQAEAGRFKRREIVTFHEAFPYFAGEFNLRIIGVIEREPGSEPNARELAETIKLVRKHNARVICVEPQYPDKSARVIADETGAKICTLDPIVTGPMDKGAYLKIMEANLSALAENLDD